MKHTRTLGAFIGIFLVLGTSLSAAVTPAAFAASHPAARHPHAWAQQHMKGYVRLNKYRALGGGHFIRKHPVMSTLHVDLTFGLRHHRALDRLIKLEARTHRYPTRGSLYAHFSPPKAQFKATRAWLTQNGLKPFYLSPDRLVIGVAGETGRIESLLHTQINDYRAPGGVTYFANTSAPRVPARLGLQTVVGLNTRAQFHTDLMTGRELRQLQRINAHQNRVRKSVISSGYFPTQYRSLYDEAGHNNCATNPCDGTGQTIGFTLWGAGTTQATFNSFAAASGDTGITLDTTDGVTTGNTGGTCVGTVASGKPQAGKPCDHATVGADQVMYILDGGNPNTDYLNSVNAETSLDMEFAHGMALHSGLKYYLAKSVSGGVTNADLLTSISDAANDTVVHTISDSWGGTDINGSQDPWYISTDNNFALAAAAGTTFYFSSGDQGSAGTGDPNDSRYVVAVGGTTLYNTSTSAAGSYSTETVWGTATQDGEGSFCAASKPRPSWQNGISGLADCPGRETPDVAATASSDATTHVYYNSASGTTSNGGFLGTSIAAPVWMGMMAATQNLINNQTYPGSAPKEGFSAPTIYQMGESQYDTSYFHQVQCGNNSSPFVNNGGTVGKGGPDGSSGGEGYSTAAGFGSPDWFTFSQGYAIALGATNLSQPANINPTYNWTCERQPMGQLLRSVTCASASVCYATAGTTNTAWQPYVMGFYLTSASITVQSAAEEQTIETRNGGASWFATNSDMIGSACLPGTTICVAVGDGGTIKRSTDGGATWNFVNTPVRKPLTSVSCPTSTVCYAAGDVGEIIKTTNAGAGWAWTNTSNTPGNPNPPGGDGNPFLGISCPSATTCYAVDLLGQVNVTTDGGNSWTQQDNNSVFTAGAQMLTGISCPTTTSCVAVGMDPSTGTHPVIWTNNGGSSWNNGTSGVSGTTTQMWTVSCAPGTTTCYEGQGSTSAIRKSTNLGATWAATGTTGGTGVVRGITCLDANTCYAAGGSASGYAVRTTNGGTSWTAVTGLGTFLEGVGCYDATHCVAAGWQGTVYTTSNGTSWSKQAGGGTTAVQNGISCMTATSCVEVGATVSSAGSILLTTNGGMTWNAQTSNAGNNALNAVSCGSSTNCVAAGAAGVVVFTTNGGTTWTTGTSGIATAINGVSCWSATACVFVGASGVIRTTANGGSTWTAQTSGTANALNAVSCAAANLCVAAGAAGTVDVSTNSGVTWATKSSGTTLALNAASCLQGGGSCYAAGAQGIITGSTDGAGNTWALQGNPISGPTSALNVSAANTVQQGAGCSSSSCYVVGSQGQLLANPRPLVVTVNVSAPYGTNPNSVLGSIANNATTVTYAPIYEGAAGAISGTLSCTTGATSTSGIGVYPLTSCSGLTDANGRTVVYDTGRGTYTVTATTSSITIDAGTLSQTYNGSPRVVTATTTPAGLNYGVTYNGSGTAPTNAGSYTVVATVNDVDSSNSPSDTETLQVAKANQTINFGPLADKTYGDMPFTVSATGGGSGNPVTFSATGNCHSGGTNGTTITITGAGSCTVTASQTGNGNYNDATSVSQSFNINQADQLITFGSISDHTFGDSDFNITATSTSGLTVSLSVDSGPCSLDSTTSPANVHISGAGSCSITASQAGDANYNAADNVTRSFVVAKADQSISFAPLPDATYGDADFSLNASASSGLDVTFSAGPGSQCTVTGTTVHITAAGFCDVIASQGGDGDYNPAPDVSQSFNIAKADQTISFAPLPDKTYGDADFTVSAGATSGFDVTFSAGATDQCTVTGNTVHITGAGSCTITASQPGDSNYNAATNVSRTFNIAKADQAISFAPLSDKTYQDPDFTVSATGGGSGNPVTFVAVGNCVSSGTDGSNISITGAGSCTVTASQAGDDNYNDAADVSQSFSIAQYTPVLSWGNPADISYPTPLSATQLDASSDVSGSFSYSPDSGAVLTAGPHILTATFTPDDPTNYVSGGTVTATINVQKGDQTISFDAIPDHTWGDSDFTLNATATSGFTVSFTPVGSCTVSGNTVHITGAGVCTITASQGGDSNWKPATSVSQSFTINPSDQTISFGAIADATYGDNSLVLTATATSGLPVSFTAGPAGQCYLSGDGVTLNLIGAGICSVTASQPGNGNYNPAPDVTHNFSINKANQTITFAGLADKTWGDGDFNVGGSATSGLPLTFSVGVADSCTISGNTVHLTGAGSCTVTANQSGNANYNAAPPVSRTFTIHKSDQTISFAPLSDRTYGDPDFLLTATASSALTVTYTATGNCTIVGGNNVHITAAGACTVTASQAGNANFNPAASVSQSFHISLGGDVLTSTTQLQLFGQGQTATVSAKLTTLGLTPIAGRTVTMTVGTSPTQPGNSCSAVTTTAGVATCSFTVSSSLVTQGYDAVTDSFSADGYYQSATNVQQSLVFAYTSGAFVLGDLSATGSVYWWGSQWAGKNSLSGGSAPSAMKGFANSVNPANSCGAAFNTTGGNSSAPPVSVPAYMAVAVSSQVIKSGSGISGNVVHVVIVRTNPGYANDPSNPGTGTVLAQIC